MTEHPPSWSARVFEALLRQRFPLLLAVLLLSGAGLLFAPFDWYQGSGRAPIAVDAIPDIGENQQIVYVSWPGQSPQDIDDQIAYPLATQLLAVPGVETVRSTSMLGSASLYVIFDEDIEYYWSRTRLMEALQGVGTESLPPGAEARLGPDATALGQVYWYTLEVRDSEGNPASGWDPHELRAIQDYQVRYALQALDDVSEVAGIGGHVMELVVEPDIAALRANSVSLAQLAAAVRDAGTSVGASTTELNGVEYIVRGDGFVEGVDDVAAAPVVTRGERPLLVRDLAHVSLQPSDRRGALDRGGSEAVGGVVVARYGANPMAVLEEVQSAVERLNRTLPRRELSDGTTVQVQLVPFYDRSGLIEDTVGTLEDALIQQMLITLAVVLLMLLHARSAAIIALILPLGVLWTFIAMKLFGVTANVVALAGIAIAIGTMVDVGIVMAESIHHELRRGGQMLKAVAAAAGDVLGAIVTAILTTVLSFLPVFLLQGAEGRLFAPLAFTKTWALLASLLVAVIVIPLASYYLLRPRLDGGVLARILAASGIAGGIVAARAGFLAAGVFLALGSLAFIVFDWLGAWRDDETQVGEARDRGTSARVMVSALLALCALSVLTRLWMPLSERSTLFNGVFVSVLVFGLIAVFQLFIRAYPTLLRAALHHRALALTVPASLLLFGALSWQGAERLLAPLPPAISESGAAEWLEARFPQPGREFMPRLDEGAFLYMPTTTTHASLGEVLEIASVMDRRFEAIPEVELAVTKIGRADSALDPAPVSMLETIVNYRDEYREDASGRRLRFAVDQHGEFVRDEAGELVEDPDGAYFRQWRSHIRSTEDLWSELQAAGRVPGLTSAPYLQPISARVVMLQSGIRANMALRVSGESLEDIDRANRSIEDLLRGVEGVDPLTVAADRSVAKPYIEVHPDRGALARHGLSMREVQQALASAVGGASAGTLFEGRERYEVRVRLPREDRDDHEAIERLPLTSTSGAQLTLADVADVRFARGPQMIRSEDARLVGYIMFDTLEGADEVGVAERVIETLDSAVTAGSLRLPEGTSYRVVGAFENAQRASARLRILVPAVLLVILMLLSIQLRSLAVAMMVFSGVAVAFAGGMVWLWLYNQPGALELSLAGVSLAEVFHVVPTNFSVAIWVGFIALFGIATDDGVVMATWLQQERRRSQPSDRDEFEQMIMDVGMRRLRPCLMTTATTLLALLPVMTSVGTGAGVMIPMAIPAFGGMSFALITLFVVPLLYSFTGPRRR